MPRDYSILRSLRQGEIVELDGALYRMATLTVDGQEVEADIQPGDTYIAVRNTRPRLLTAERVDYEKLYCIFPRESAYAYDLGECVKVEVVREATEADRTAFTGPSAEELRRLFARPFDINDSECRVNHRLLFRDWAQHCDVEFVATEGLELEDGTWMIEGYPLGTCGRVQLEYHPGQRRGTLARAQAA